MSRRQTGSDLHEVMQHEENRIGRIDPFTTRNETRSTSTLSTAAPPEYRAHSHRVIIAIICISSALCILFLAIVAISLGRKYLKKHQCSGTYQPNNEEDVSSWIPGSSSIKFAPKERLI